MEDTGCPEQLLDPLSLLNLYTAILLALFRILVLIDLCGLLALLVVPLDLIIGAYPLIRLFFPFQNGNRNLLPSLMVLLSILLFLLLDSLFLAPLLGVVHRGLDETIPDFLAFSLIQFAHPTNLLDQLFVLL